MQILIPMNAQHDHTFAERLKQARTLAGLSQKALAEQTQGLTADSLSRYEKGERLPDSVMLIRLAQALGVSPDALMQPILVRPTALFYRKHSQVGKKELKRIEARIQQQAEAYLMIEEELGILAEFSNPLADEAVSNATQAREAARRLRREWNVGNDPIAHVIEWLEDQGIKVVEIDTDENLDGVSTYVHYAGRPCPVVVLKRENDVFSRRLTALHELGHLLLPLTEATQADHTLTENCCNAFASEMLMPSELLKRRMGQMPRRFDLNELVNLKGYFGASVAALARAARDLGIYSESTYKGYSIWRNQHPERRMETGMGIWPHDEHSHRFMQLAWRAYSQDLLTDREAAMLLGLSLPVFLTQVHSNPAPDS